jgi:drug/metabolite transporter (DMT)-like permease
MVLLPAVLTGRIKALRRSDALRMALFGLSGMTAYQLLLYYGEETIPAGEAALLITLSPVFSTVLGSLLLRERPDRRGVAALTIALTGALTVAGTASGPLGRPSAGAALVVGAAAAQALSFAGQKPLLQRYGGTECVLYGSLFGLVPLLPSSMRAAQQIWDAPASSTAAVLWLGCCCTATAFWTWSRVLQSGSVGTSSLCLYAVPVAALALDAVLLHHVPMPGQIAGGCVVLAGIAVATSHRPLARGADPTPRNRLQPRSASVHLNNHGSAAQASRERTPM